MDFLLSRQFLIKPLKSYRHANFLKTQNSKTNEARKNLLFRPQIQNFVCNNQDFSTKPDEFSELISPKNKDRVIKNLLSVKPHRLLPLKKNYRQAATLIPMCIVNGELSLLYTVRSNLLNYSRGDISFPGGMMDESDEDLTQTALRETYEEIGLSSNSIQLWGPMLPITDYQATKLITAFVAFCGEIEPTSLKFNKNEVSLVFSRTIAQLCQPELQAMTQFRTGYTLPIYLGQPDRIWGLTALTTFQFLSILTPDKHQFNLKYQRPLIKTKRKS